MEKLQRYECQHCARSILNAETTEWYKGKEYTVPALLRELEDTKEELERYKRAVKEGQLVPSENQNEKERGPNPILIATFAVIATAFAFVARIMLAG